MVDLVEALKKERNARVRRISTFMMDSPLAKQLKQLVELRGRYSIGLKV